MGPYDVDASYQLSAHGSARRFKKSPAILLFRSGRNEVPPPLPTGIHIPRDSRFQVHLKGVSCTVRRSEGRDEARAGEQGRLTESAEQRVAETHFRRWEQEH